MGKNQKIKLFFSLLILAGLLGIASFWVAKKISLTQKESLEIITYPNQILREVAQPVEEIGPAERELAQLMINTMGKAGGVGLAAPQVGISKRMAIVKLSRGFFQKEILVLINPEIIEKEGQVSGREGCLSIPGKWIEVNRSEKIMVRYKTLAGQEEILEEKG